LHGEALPVRSDAARTPFTSCKGTGVIHEGVLTNNDLDIAMQYLKASGQGNVDIANNTLDYRLSVKVLRLSETNSNAGDLIDADIPVKISGTISSPSVRPDLEGLAKARLKQEVDKQKDKLRGRLQDKLKDILGGKE
ncbi:MAG TPA: AsmA-like C-terminal region-containing protein, partial [Steroidobacteraceae bacterium]|nr:AsmA-like C-terminal region-containing protein [Steroidobacteraceae bacterium]